MNDPLQRVGRPGRPDGVLCVGVVVGRVIVVGLLGLIALQACSLITRNVNLAPDVWVVVEMVSHARYEE
ncbi:MAG: hypothetical protein ACRCT2_00160 [Plesiomonas shigelloides]